MAFVESEEGKGSTFHFTLPCNTGSENETIDLRLARSDRNDDFRKQKILMVEDDEVSEMLLDETVKIFSKEILNARTGVKAVQACRDNPAKHYLFVCRSIHIPRTRHFEGFLCFFSWKITRVIQPFNDD